MFASAIALLAALACTCMNNVQWQQAVRDLAHGGLALRSAVFDAPAAYLASLGSSLTRCSELDPSFDRGAVLASTAVSQALSLVNTHLDTQLALEVAITKRQRCLTKLLDHAGFQRLLAASPPVAKAMLLSEYEPGARAFLTAVPSGRCRMEPASFVAEVRLRLGIPDSASDTWCPKCDAVLDAYSHHAGLCSVGGERTQRHNAVRDVVCTWTERAGLQPEKERASLLLPRRPEDVHLSRRRPADIYVPCLEGTPTALDFAITGPQRTESLSQAMHQPVSAAAAYADLKANHQDTARLCFAQGICFRPMVAETTGAWDKSAAHVLHIIAAAVAAREGATVAELHQRLLQELSVTARRFRAQAALRR